jgi:hypothetical protein
VCGSPVGDKKIVTIRKDQTAEDGPFILALSIISYYIQFVLLVYQPPANNIFRTTYHHQSLGINRLALLFFLTANQHHPPTISQTNKTESSS